jgi:hypothetical protein
MTIRRTLGMICAILFVPSLVFALVTTNLEKSLFDPQLYKDAIKAAQVYERLPGLIATQIEASAAKQGGIAGLLVGALPPDTVQNMFISVLPPEVLQPLVEKGIDQALAYVNGMSGQADVPLVSFREQVAASSGGLVDEYFKSLPDCTLLDAFNMAGGLIAGGGDLPKCNPPEAVREAVAAPLQAVLQDQLAQIFPESLSMASGGGGLESLFSALRWVRVAAELTPLLALFFFGAMTLLAIRTSRELLRWWGITLLVAGILAFLAGLLIGPATGGFLNVAVLSRLSASVAPGIAQILTQVASAVASGIARPILLDALLVSVLGGGLLLAARFAPKEMAAYSDETKAP